MRHPSFALAALVAGAALLPAAVAGADGSPAGQPRQRAGPPAWTRPGPKAGIRMTQAPADDPRPPGACSSTSTRSRRRRPAGGAARRRRGRGLRLCDPLAREQKAVEGFVALDRRGGGGGGAGCRHGVAGAASRTRNVGAATSQGVRAPAATGPRAGSTAVASPSPHSPTPSTSRTNARRRRAPGRPRRRRHPHRRPAARGRDRHRGRPDAASAPTKAARCSRSSTTSRRGPSECFATALTGELGFANNIRALADPNGPCGADVDVDDVGYFDEPFFCRGPIGDAVDDVAAQGVHYFSSAGNAPTSRPTSAAADRPAGTARPRARTSTSAASTRRCTRAASRTSTPGRGTTSRRTSWRPTTRRASWTSSGTTRWTQRRAARRPADQHHGEITAAQPVAKIPFYRHRGADDPRDRRRDPVRLDRPHPRRSTTRPANG